jgi:hypothetical protein
MKIFVGVLLILHGLITAAQSPAGFNPSGGTPNPSWVNWWPTNLGQSWFLARLDMEKSFLGTLSGILWLIAGIALIAAALGLFGFAVPTMWWRVLAGVGAVISLFLFIFYAHPLFAVGIGANLAILLVLLLAKWPSPELLGS